MSGFAIRNPYFIIVCCLVIAIVGTTVLVRMPVDLFPPINIPVVVVATFYSGMPPEQIETDITGRFERFFTLGSNIDHMESRSLPGVSLIKIYFQPGTDPDADLSEISNLAMADLRKLPPGTLPPVVLKFDASSLPVCLITLKGQGLSETKLRDLGQYDVRNQVANVQGASVPQPFGGRYRQIMVYVDPLKLQAHELSVMDVVRTVNDSNLILPAGDVKIGPIDYNLYTNSQLPNTQEINSLPLKTVGNASVLVQDVGKALDSHEIQTNVVRVDGQPSVYLPILKQGGDTNTIAIVNGIKNAVKDLTDVPKQLVAKVVFDQSIFVKKAINSGAWRFFPIARNASIGTKAPMSFITRRRTGLAGCDASSMPRSPPMDVPTHSTSFAPRWERSSLMSERNCPKWYARGEESQSLSPRPAKSTQTTRASLASARARKSKSRALPL